MVPYLEAMYHALTYQGKKNFSQSQSEAETNLAPANFRALCDSCLYLEPDKVIAIVLAVSLP